MEVIRNSGYFQKGNKLGGRKPGSLNKKTIVRESLERLNDVGITPLETTNEILNSLDVTVVDNCYPENIMKKINCSWCEIII